MNTIQNDPFLDYCINPNILCQEKSEYNLQSNYNYLPLKLESPTEHIEENLRYLTIWISRFLEDKLPLGISPLGFMPLGIIAGACFTNPRGNSTVHITGEHTKGFGKRQATERWGICYIAIHGIIANVVYDRHNPGSFIADQCRYFPVFCNAMNPEHAKLMRHQLISLKSEASK